MVIIIYIILLVTYLVYFASLITKENKSKLGEKIFKTSIVLVSLGTFSIIGQYAGQGLNISLNDNVILNILYSFLYNLFSLLAVILISFVDTENK